MISFWQKLKRPFFVLAPMEDVTDTVFRQIIIGCGKPDVFFTEFVSCDGLMSSGFEKVSQRLNFSKEEKPIIAQLFGKNPENFYKASKLILKMGFDGIDINLGCPEKVILKQGTGGALIGENDLVKEIFKATKKGAGKLPVSIKTRIGLKTIETEKWIGFLLKLNSDALTIHGRTVAELSKVPAHWEEIGKAVRMRNTLGSKTVIIGNGDIKSYQEGLEKAKNYGVEGVMIGRGVFENPWVFNKDVDIKKITPEEKIKVLIDHIKLFEKTWGDKKNFNILKKFFKIYVTGFPGASDLRGKLMETRNFIEVYEIIDKYLKC
ncbi:MAG: tRNA-dihydrouridine synthase [Candidatus Daviesbacteria bacterium]